MINQYRFASYVIMFFFLSLSSMAKEHTAKKRIDDIENRLMDLEIDSFLKKIHWSGNFLNTYDNFNTSNALSDPYNRSTNTFQSELNLSVSTQVHEDIYFYANFRSAYFYNQAVQSAINDIDNPRNQITGSVMRLSKAYFDYNLWNNNIIYSMGRLPTFYGPPEHFTTADPRLGTYPLIGYSLPLDGIALSWKAHKNFDLIDKLVFRLIYSPFSIGNPGNIWDGLSAGDTTSSTGRLARSKDATTLMVEYSNNRISAFKRLSTIIQAYKFEFGRPPRIEVRGLATGDQKLYEVFVEEDSLFKTKTIVLHQEFEDILQSGFDFYFSWRWNEINPTGTLKAEIIDDGTTGAANGVQTTIGGFLVNEKTSGETQLYGLRYRINDKNFIGTEYITSHYGSIGTSLFTTHSTNFYNAIGRGVHGYFIHKFIPKKLKFKVGHSNVLNTYSAPSGFRYTEDRSRVLNTYAQMILRF